jgi:hypothetical protein
VGALGKFQDAAYRLQIDFTLSDIGLD